MLVGPLLAIQPPFDINFPWSLGYIRKLVFGSPWGNYFTPCLFAANVWRPGISNLHRHSPFRVLYQITHWSSGASEIHFLCPEKSMLSQCRIQTRDLSIFSQTHYHWTNTPCSPMKKVKQVNVEVIIDLCFSIFQTGSQIQLTGSKSLQLPTVTSLGISLDGLNHLGAQKSVSSAGSVSQGAARFVNMKSIPFICTSKIIKCYYAQFSLQKFGCNLIQMIDIYNDKRQMNNNVSF